MCHTEALGTMGCFLAWVLLRLIRCGVCVLWHVLSLQAPLSGLVNLEASAVLADFTTSASCGHRCFSIASCRCCLARQIGVLILPPSRAPLGWLFNELICSFIQGFLLSEEWFGLLTLTAVGAVFPAANCLSSCHQPRPGCHTIYSWWSLVSPE